MTIALILTATETSGLKTIPIRTFVHRLLTQHSEAHERCTYAGLLLGSRTRVRTTGVGALDDSEHLENCFGGAEEVSENGSPRVPGANDSTQDDCLVLKRSCRSPVTSCGGTPNTSVRRRNQIPQHRNTTVCAHHESGVSEVGMARDNSELGQMAKFYQQASKLRHIGRVFYASECAFFRKSSNCLKPKWCLGCVERIVSNKWKVNALPDAPEVGQYIHLCDSIENRSCSEDPISARCLGAPSAFHTSIRARIDAADQDRYLSGCRFDRHVGHNVAFAF